MDFWDFFGFLDFKKKILIFRIFFEFFFGGLPFKVTNVTTKRYQGYNSTPKIAKSGPKKHNKLFICRKGKKSLGRSPPQEPEVGPRGGPYLLVYLIVLLKQEAIVCKFREKRQICCKFFLWSDSLLTSFFKLIADLTLSPNF